MIRWFWGFRGFEDFDLCKVWHGHLDAKIGFWRVISVWVFRFSKVYISFGSGIGLGSYSARSSGTWLRVSDLRSGIQVGRVSGLRVYVFAFRLREKGSGQ